MCRPRPELEIPYLSLRVYLVMVAGDELSKWEMREGRKWMGDSYPKKGMDGQRAGKVEAHRAQCQLGR